MKGQQALLLVIERFHNLPAFCVPGDENEFL